LVPSSCLHNARHQVTHPGLPFASSGQGPFLAAVRESKMHSGSAAPLASLVAPEILSSGLFCATRDGDSVGRQSLLVDNQAPQGCANLGSSGFVTVKQVKGWQRVIVLRRPRKNCIDMAPGFGLPNEQGGAGQEGNGRWGSLPARLRWSLPDFNKTEQLERPTPRKPINAGVPVPICTTSRSRSFRIPCVRGRGVRACVG
jgi:hypothetical protein